MISLGLRKEQPVPNNQPPPTKSKWQLVIDHMNAANQHLNEAMHIIATIGFDLQKPADFITRYRDTLIKAIEEAGGVVESPGQSVEEQIREFIPKNYRPEEPPSA